MTFFHANNFFYLFKSATKLFVVEEKKNLYNSMDAIVTLGNSLLF